MPTVVQSPGASLLSALNGSYRTCAENARLVKSRSAEFVLDVCDAGRVDCPDLLELERPAVEPRE
jgi:hypothetical protein